ncbi:wall-associated receptor kinase 2-like [Malania oleifera]|uniref:wall-associated receptor kinase 2-like n=1 Tax=Malania oleifera TaxID=397392 RepID=UPI0025ADED00|nr:wall-associated receptor kinase 2-like [Malania oleifera]
MQQMRVWASMIILLSSLAAAAVEGTDVDGIVWSRDGCPDRCGNVTIPFPFGTKDECSYSKEFFITCNDTFHPPKPFLMKGNVEVLQIQLEGHLNISHYVGCDCYTKDQRQDYYFDPSLWLTPTNFTVSNTQNIFMAIGCDTYAYVTGYRGRRKYTTGCMSVCASVEDVRNGTCEGVGCCQVSIPPGLDNITVKLSSYYSHSDIWNFSPCSYAFVVEKGHFNFSSYLLQDLRYIRRVPVMLDWAIVNRTCAAFQQDRSSYTCGKNTECFDNNITSTSGGYVCKCIEGFHGNPYLPGGCRDIDECEKDSPCIDKIAECHNFPGSYNCTCQAGYQGDGKKAGSKCSPIPRRDIFERLALIIIPLGVGIGLIVAFVIITCIYLGVKKKKIRKLKEDHFKENGGIMLRELLSKRESSAREGSAGKAKIFTEEELNKATNNFSESRIIGQGGFGTVYRGILKDDSVVAIKKSKIVDRGQIQQFVNEMIILSQINHKNVVKLLGFCLETSVPMLVYEFITNKTLFHHIHCKGHTSSLSWPTRLRIAAETAGAIAHMHSNASMHIIHRDIKSANILLDDECIAKVSDFGASRFVPLDQTQLSTLVQGTLGYIDPDYFQSGQLTDKSDVYSFGVVLAELLTGQNVLSEKRPESQKNLVMYFISSLKEDHLLEVLDERVKIEGHLEQLKGVAELANNCLRMTKEKRPTMKEVESELVKLMRNETYTQVVIERNSEDAVPLLGEPLNFCYDSTSAGSNSLKNRVMMPFHSGR